MRNYVIAVLWLVTILLLACSPKGVIQSRTSQDTVSPILTLASQTPTDSPTKSVSPTPTTALPTTTIRPSPTRPLPPVDAFIKGIHFADWKSSDAPIKGLYLYPRADASLKELATTGASWISIVITRHQETISSTKISHDPPMTATDEEISRVVKLAHSMGMRVMLWPGLVLSNDPGHWWGQIGTTFTESQWLEWFAAYRESINHYATLAQESGADMLSLGAEAGGTTHREADWRRVVQEARERYKGLITYSALNTTPWGFPHSEENRIQWWDAVDYIGVSAYYGLTDRNDPTLEQLKTTWIDKGYIALLENLSKKFNKPIILSEIGYSSYDGNNKMPAAGPGSSPVDLQEQADCYQAILEVIQDKPWIEGIFWWQWWVGQVGGSNDTSITPYHKPAEEVLRDFYQSDTWR